MNASLKVAVIDRSGRALRPRTAYDKRRKRLIRQGRWQPYTPAQPVRDHVTAVRAATGMSVTQFAGCAGLDQTTVNKIFTSGQAAVTVAIAARILAVTPAVAPDTGLVDATGARRRLQGLTWAGYTAPVIAAAASLSTDTVSLIRNGGQPRILVATARQVTAVYEALLRRPMPRNDHPRGTGPARAVSLAAHRGWAPPWTWDDIDDPDATPKGLRPEDRFKPARDSRP